MASSSTSLDRITEGHRAKRSVPNGRVYSYAPSMGPHAKESRPQNTGGQPARTHPLPSSLHLRVKSSPDVSETAIPRAPSRRALSRVFSELQSIGHSSVGKGKGKLDAVEPGSYHRVGDDQSQHPESKPKRAKLVRNRSAHEASGKHLRRVDTVTSSKSFALPPIPLPPLKVSARQSTTEPSSSKSASPVKEGDECRDAESQWTADAERIQQARVAKLSRHLGEDIPPELVMPSAGELARTSGTIRRKPSHHRRKSLDLVSLLSSDPFSSAGSDDSIYNKERPVRRSKSVWSTQTVSARTDDSEAMLIYSKDAGQRVDSMREGRSHLSEKQRALNVRRARKIAQVFGAEPPPELCRAALAARLREADGSSIISVDVHEEPGMISLSTTKLFLAEPVQLHSVPRPSPNTAQVDTLGEKQILDDAKVDEVLDITSPSFATLNSISQTLDKPLPPIEEPLHHLPMTESTTDTFTIRRRRAAKLAQFFGVDYQNLTTSPQSPKFHQLPQVQDAPHSRHVENVFHVARTANMPSPPDDVDIEISKPARFWGLMDAGNVKTVTVDDVIGQLRGMKAAR